jgi:hypothetical protein
MARKALEFLLSDDDRAHLKKTAPLRADALS